MACTLVDLRYLSLVDEAGFTEKCRAKDLVEFLKSLAVSLISF